MALADSLLAILDRARAEHFDGGGEPAPPLALVVLPTLDDPASLAARVVRASAALRSVYAFRPIATERVETIDLEDGAGPRQCLVYARRYTQAVRALEEAGFVSEAAAISSGVTVAIVIAADGSSRTLELEPD